MDIRNTSAILVDRFWEPYADEPRLDAAQRNIDAAPDPSSPDDRDLSEIVELAASIGGGRRRHHYLSWRRYDVPITDGIDRLGVRRVRCSAP